MSLTRARALAGLGAGASLLATAVVAFAAPDRTAELSSAKPSFSWDGGPLTAAVLGVSDKTDNTQVSMPEGGNISIKLSDFKEPTGAGADFDIYLYASDAAGNETGSALGTAETTDAEKESLTVKNLKPGSYIVEVDAYATVNGTFKGVMTFSGGAAAPSPSTTPTGTPAAGTTPGATDQTPDTKISKVSAKKRTFAGTATDDKGVRKVEVALQLTKGKKCTQMTKSGKFVKEAKCGAPSSWLAAKGTTTWSYKFKKKLKKGSYTVLARATDSAGQVQAGFTPANMKAFKVK